MNKPRPTPQLQINVSISDFSPLLRGSRYLFEGLQKTGAHGIELWVGAKSRWSANHYVRLAQKHNLPIVSLHQPLWAMTGAYFDEGFFELAKYLNVQHVTCHPLPNIAMQSAQMRAYFRRLAAAQKRTGIAVLVENLPQTYRNKLLHGLFPPNVDTKDIVKLQQAASEFGLGLTLDTDHLRLPEPHAQPWFRTVLPSVRNIHLSSFSSTAHHLPLYEGDLQVQPFMQALQTHNYGGTITLEISAPKSITAWQYDFGAIKKSIQLLNQGKIIS